MLLVGKMEILLPMTDKIPEPIILDWFQNKKRIQDRLNRINKQLKKYTKQKSHFEKRLRIIAEYEKRAKNTTPS